MVIVNHQVIKSFRHLQVNLRSSSFDREAIRDPYDFVFDNRLELEKMPISVNSTVSTSPSLPAG